MIVYEIECQECNATYEIKHHLNTSRYDIVYCSFCNSDNIEIEEYDDDEDEIDYSMTSPNLWVKEPSQLQDTILNSTKKFAKSYLDGKIKGSHFGT